MARASLVVSGQIVLAARPEGLETAEAIGIEAGRVVAAGSRRDVLDAAVPAARRVDVGQRVVVPGLHDAHLHLVWLARARREVNLDAAGDFGALLEAVRVAARTVEPGGWLTGRGWNEATLDHGRLDELEAALGDRPALLTSHDGHSVWASAAARSLAGLRRETPEPPGGRIERDSRGEPTGVLRETARELVAPLAVRLRGRALAETVDETVRDLTAYGLTGATDAGDLGADSGVGAYAELGDSFSSLTELAPRIGGRLRLNVNLPAEAIGAAAVRGLRTGETLAEEETLRVGWAKVFADGALGSRTAALLEPYSCADATGSGLLRLDSEQMAGIVAEGRRAGIRVAIHAIGDRATAAALDAISVERPVGAAPTDRLEHAQLLRHSDRARLAALGVTASMQPVHAAADRRMVDDCWKGREANAFAWRSLLAAGAVLAFGSDAPVETADPWAGMFAAVHRRFATDDEPDWRPQEALDVVSALAAYTFGPAAALGLADEGHLRVGARADLAVLDCDLATLLSGDERLASIRSELTLVGGREVYRS